MLVSLAAMVMSCSKQQELVGAGSRSSGTVTLSLDQLASKADQTNMSRYILEVYEGQDASGTMVSHTEQATSSFTIEFIQGNSYTFLSWADHGTPNDNTTGDYDAASLKAIKVVSGKTPAKEAFGGKLTVTVDETASYDMVLKHSVAQVNFIQKEDFTKAVTTFDVTFAQTFQLNIATNAATEILNVAASVPATYKFTNIAQASKDKTIGTSYIIASTDAANKTLMTLTTIVDNAQDNIEITSVPFTMNYRTNITGAYSNYFDSKMGSTCEADWNTPENNRPFPVIPEVGFFVYGDGTYAAKHEAAPAPVSGLRGTRAAGDTCIGIVYWVDPVKKDKVKIICSAYPTGKNWVTNKFNNVWSIVSTDIPGAKSESDGKANTLAITQAPDYSAENYPLVAWCVGRTEGGYSWYIPSVDEMREIDRVQAELNAAYETIYPKNIPSDEGPYALNRYRPYRTSTSVDAGNYKQVIFSSAEDPFAVASQSKNDGANMRHGIAIAEVSLVLR